MKTKIYNLTSNLSANFSAFKPGRIYLLSIAFTLLGLFNFNQSQAQTGEALHFDGVDDKVDLPFVISGSYTKEAWIYVDPAGLTGFPNILTGTQTSLQLANGVLTAGHNPGYNQAVDQTGALTANTWYHIAVTYDATTLAINLYKNGVLVSVPGSTAPNYTETVMRIGTFNNGFYFPGEIDEVRFWDVARTGAEINATMGCNLTGDEPYLRAYYDFNQGVANGDNTAITSLEDRQNNCISNDGTLVGFALTGTTSNFVDTGAFPDNTCLTSYPNINVTGNTNCIVNGDVTPVITDNTDFGNFLTTPIERTFIIENNGLLPLIITSTTITGIDAADFTITSTPAPVVAPGGSTSLTISFNPTGAFTVRNATVTITNDDPDEGPFVFDITGLNSELAQSLSFDGINDSVYLPVYISGSYTKEAWINTADLTGFPNIISGDSTALFLNNGQLAAGHFPGFAQIVDVTTPVLMADTWTHIAVSYDSATTTLRLFRDGVEVGVNTATPSYNDTLSLGTFGQSNFYAGLLDEVRIWDVARTQAEIAANMNCNLTGDEFFLQAYYKFNQGAAGGNNPTETILRDSADKCVPLDGTLFNFALTGATSNWVAPGAPVTGTCAGTFQNISVSGTVCIQAGDSTASVTDNTDFGLNLTGQTTDQTFTITNTGSADLTIGTIDIAGVDASLFTVLTLPGGVIAPGASTTFTIRFLSILEGTFNAVVTVNNSDPDQLGFSFAVQASASVLTPVTLLNFDGILSGSNVKLNWKTATELNNKGFEILRSNNSQTSWEKIGFVNATNSSRGSSYMFTDLAPLNGVNTYRLRQVDIDGRATFSDIVFINKNDNSTIVNVYPNPFQQTVNIIFNDSKLLNTVAKIVSVTGKTVANVTLKNYRQEVNLNSMAPGMYFISFTNGEVIRLIKQ